MTNLSADFLGLRTTMTSEELKTICAKFYGERIWISALAKELGIAVSTVWRWSQGKTKISPVAERAIRQKYADFRAEKTKSRTLRGKQ